MAESEQGRLLGLADIDKATDALRAFIAAEGVEALEDAGKTQGIGLPDGMMRPLADAARAKESGATSGVLAAARAADAHVGLAEFNNAVLAIASYADNQERWDAVCLTAALFAARGVDRARVYGWLSTLNTAPDELAALGSALGLMSRGALVAKADDLYAAKRWTDRDFTLARRCYLALGSRPLAAEQRGRLLDIFQRRAENLVTVALGAVFCAIALVFALVFGVPAGAASGAFALAGAVVCAVVFGLALRRLRSKPFNGLSALIPALYAAWVLCTVAVVMTRAL